MPYRGFSGGGFVGNFLSTTLLEQLRPAADNAGRQATVGDPSTRAAPYRSDGESWKAVALIDETTGSLVSGDRNLPIQTAASKYGGNYAKALLLLNQSGGPSVLPVDYSGNSTAITFGGNTTTPWANAGYFTSVAAVAQNTALVVPASAVALSLLTDSFLMAFTLNKATPAGVETLCGCTDLSTQPGFNININASGYVGPRLRVNGATVATTYGTHAAADGADHRVMLTWDAPTKTVTAYVDGVSSVVQTAGTVLSTDVVATALALGRATTGDSVAGKFAGFLFCTFAASGLPLNMSELVTLDNTRRRSGITDLSVFF